MAEIGPDIEQPGADPQSEGGPEERGRQSMLLRLAERTVLQAETLAQEITDRARHESEAEGAKLRQQHLTQAQEEARQLIDSAEQQCLTLTNETRAKAQAESEDVLGKAQAEVRDLLGKAQAEGQEMVGKAEAEGQAILGNAQAAEQEIMARAHRESQNTINASKSLAESIESNAKLRAEFIVRQMTQSVADGLRRAVMETCNNLLPDLEQLDQQVLQIPDADEQRRGALSENNSAPHHGSFDTDAAAQPGSQSEGRPTEAGEESSSSGSRTSDRGLGKKKAKASSTD